MQARPANKSPSPCRSRNSSRSSKPSQRPCTARTTRQRASCWRSSPASTPIWKGRRAAGSRRWRGPPPRAAGARTAELAFHRDASAADLLGEVHLRRERAAHGRGERISLELAAGPSARAEVLVLDDLSRAPGEALGAAPARARRAPARRPRAAARERARNRRRAGPRELRRPARADPARPLRDPGAHARAGRGAAFRGGARAARPRAGRRRTGAVSTPNGVTRCSAGPRRSRSFPRRAPRCCARSRISRAPRAASRRCSPTARSRAPRPRSSARTRWCAAPSRSSPPTCARSASCWRAACPRRSSPSWWD